MVGVFVIGEVGGEQIVVGWGFLVDYFVGVEYVWVSVQYQGVVLQGIEVYVIGCVDCFGDWLW